jgi:hypothetical protein
MEAEKINYTIENGEAVAPVSSIYKKFINRIVNDCVDRKDKTVYTFQAFYLKTMLKHDDMFKKTSKKFQKEVMDLLDLPFPEFYEAYTGEPLEVESENEGKPNLTLVK